MSETFELLIENTISDFFGKALSKVKDRASALGDELLAPVSNSAAGRADLRDETEELRAQFKYFLATQQERPTISTYVDFINTTFGLKLPEESVHKLVFGRPPHKGAKPPVMNAPNKEVIDGNFKAIMKKGTKPEDRRRAADINATFADRNAADKDYVVAFTTWIGTQYPQVMKFDGFDPLEPFAHGGELDQKQITALLTAMAKSVIKRRIELDREGGKEEGKEEGESKAEAETPYPSTEDKISINPPVKPENESFLKVPSKREMPAEMPFARIAENIMRIGYTKMWSLDKWIKIEQSKNAEDLWETHATNMTMLASDYRRGNAITSQLMYLAARNANQADAFADYVEVGMKNYWSNPRWPRTRILKTFQFASKGGHFDDITAEINQFIKRPTAAGQLNGLVFRFAINYIIKERGLPDKVDTEETMDTSE